jgi:hypothetical protein
MSGKALTTSGTLCCYELRRARWVGGREREREGKEKRVRTLNLFLAGNFGAQFQAESALFAPMLAISSSFLALSTFLSLVRCAQCILA